MGRKVIGFMTDSQPDPDLECQVYVLDGQGHGRRRARHRADPARPRGQGAARGGGALPRLPVVARRDPDRVRRRAGERAGDADRRGPGRPGGRAGKPFVGPAGKLLDKAVAEAGLDREPIYRTNVVKHFKFEPRGKRRIHQTPSKLEVEACRPWLDEELRRVRPSRSALLGATAAKALSGPGFRVSQRRGELLEVDFAEAAVATYHPSSVLRGPPEEREEAYAALVADLRVLASATG